MSPPKHKHPKKVGRKPKRTMKNTKAVFNKGRPRKFVGDMSMSSFYRRYGHHKIYIKFPFEQKKSQESSPIGSRVIDL